METIKYVLDVILHLNKYLGPFIEQYGVWIYLILFLVIFCETGLVVTPFLPGDSLLFAIGALCAPPASLNLYLILGLLSVAAILGDTVNYWIGYSVGPKVFNRANGRFLNKENLDKTHAFYEKYGGKAIILARFMPIFRTFVPFVAGIGRMSYGKFMSFNVVGGLVWIFSFVIAGYFFGNMPIVKKNFSMVILVIIILSILPGVIEFIRHRRNSRLAKISGH